MKIDVKEKLVKVGEKVHAESQLLIFKDIEKKNLMSITIPSHEFSTASYDMIYCSDRTYEFSIYDEDLGYVDFKIKPNLQHQEKNVRDLILAFLLLHKN